MAMTAGMMRRKTLTTAATEIRNLITADKIARICVV